MLIADGIFDAFKWAALGAFVIAIGVALVFVPKNVDRKSELAAKVRKRALVVLGAIVAFAFVGFVGPAFGAPVVIVKSGPDKTRATLFGSRAYAFQDGHAETMTASAGHTTIVNDSKTAMRLQTESYGDPGAALLHHLTPPLEVRPMTITTSDHRVDFIGPDDVPPKRVEGVYAEERYWLTW